ncbi:MAG TPA: PKD domain-containing protein [Candidatus Angelobacter sp.]|nr:PKD domain-containing protein [Candidatus Angelobacter sp.]
MPRNTVVSILSAWMLFSLAAAAQTRFNPTTTLTAETSNNTSAADAFPGQSNGNAAAGNVSKVPLQSLLYSGSTAKLYAHLVQWFGYKNHVDVGYNSGDALQVQKQVTDMVSRGLDGAIIDWYGRGNTQKILYANDESAQLLMHEAEQHPGFNFALMLDAGSTRECEKERDCNPAENLIEDLNYAYRTYEGSAAYLKQDGRPVVLFFGYEKYGIDWRRVRARLDGNPVLIFRNSGAFNKKESDGGFSWVAPLEADKRDPMALDYLDYYYRTAQRHAGDFSLGSAYKGFDDSIALWGTKRSVEQQCGQTWLRSIAEADQFYSSQQQMIGIQLVTWNDYEEGTEFESGIENCVKIAAGTRGTSVFWKINGDDTTIDHYTVFLSQDGETLMPVANAAADTRALNLAPFSLQPAEYTVYVKAVGKSSMTNHMSEGRRLTISASSSNVVNTASHVSAGMQVSVSGNGAAPAMVAVTLNGAFLPQQALIDFGDGTIVAGQTSVEHVYRLSGTYTIMATVENQAGLKSTKTAVVNVTAP